MAGDSSDWCDASGNAGPRRLLNGRNGRDQDGAPAWTQWVLRLAAIYNLAWGAWVVLRPQDLFNWSGLPAINHAFVWQCLGMVVGVYGIAYAIAAQAPYRNWAIVLVGLIGKVLGPIGMANQWTSGVVTSRFASLVLFNDLIWWIPFALILYGALANHLREEADDASPELDLALSRYTNQHGRSLLDICSGQLCLVVCLRHLGCTFCREALSDLKAGLPELNSAAIRLVIVHPSTEEHGSNVARSYGLDNVDRVRDESGQLYRALGVKRGSPNQLFGPLVMVRGAWTFFSGHGIGSVSGDVTRLGASFLLRDGEVLKSYFNKSAADHPDYVAFALGKDQR